MHGQKPAVSDVRVQIIDEFLIGVDRNEHWVWSHPFQNRTAKGADAWAIFFAQLHILPINGLQHGTDQCWGGRNNGPDNDRGFSKETKEVATGTQTPNAGAQQANR